MPPQNQNNKEIIDFFKQYPDQIQKCIELFIGAYNKIQRIAVQQQIIKKMYAFFEVEKLITDSQIEEQIKLFFQFLKEYNYYLHFVSIMENILEIKKLYPSDRLKLWCFENNLKEEYKTIKKIIHERFYDKQKILLQIKQKYPDQYESFKSLSKTVKKNIKKKKTSTKNNTNSNRNEESSILNKGKINDQELSNRHKRKTSEIIKNQSQIETADNNNSSIDDSYSISISSIESINSIKSNEVDDDHRESVGAVESKESSIQLSSDFELELSSISMDYENNSIDLQVNQLIFIHLSQNNKTLYKQQNKTNVTLVKQDGNKFKMSKQESSSSQQNINQPSQPQNNNRQQKDNLQNYSFLEDQFNPVKKKQKTNQMEQGEFVNVSQKFRKNSLSGQTKANPKESTNKVSNPGRQLLSQGQSNELRQLSIISQQFNEQECHNFNSPSHPIYQSSQFQEMCALFFQKYIDYRSKKLQNPLLDHSKNISNLKQQINTKLLSSNRQRAELQSNFYLSNEKIAKQQQPIQDYKSNQKQYKSQIQQNNQRQTNISSSQFNVRVIENASDFLEDFLQQRNNSTSVNEQQSFNKNIHLAKENKSQIQKVSESNNFHSGLNEMRGGNNLIYSAYQNNQFLKQYKPYEQKQEQQFQTNLRQQSRSNRNKAKPHEIILIDSSSSQEENYKQQIQFKSKKDQQVMAGEDQIEKEQDGNNFYKKQQHNEREQSQLLEILQQQIFKSTIQQSQRSNSSLISDSEQVDKLNQNITSQNSPVISSNEQDDMLNQNLYENTQFTSQQNFEESSRQNQILERQIDKKSVDIQTQITEIDQSTEHDQVNQQQSPIQINNNSEQQKECELGQFKNQQFKISPNICKDLFIPESQKMDKIKVNEVNFCETSQLKSNDFIDKKQIINNQNIDEQSELQNDKLPPQQEISIQFYESEQISNNLEHQNENNELNINKHLNQLQTTFDTKCDKQTESLQQENSPSLLQEQPAQETIIQQEQKQPSNLVEDQEQLANQTKNVVQSDKSIEQFMTEQEETSNELSRQTLQLEQLLQKFCFEPKEMQGKNESEKTDKVNLMPNCTQLANTEVIVSEEKNYTKEQNSFTQQRNQNIYELCQQLLVIHSQDENNQLQVNQLKESFNKLITQIEQAIKNS